MLDLGEIPSGVPNTYVYLLSKAKMYLIDGPVSYRENDFFEMPLEDWSEELLAVVQNGMKQICQFRGYSPENPFTGLGIDGFYALLSTLHFQLEMQSVSRSDDAVFIDELQMKHRVTGELIVLFNLVPHVPYD